ncbi:transcription factor bHLH113 isoform X2 [Capsella rubella]|uniref:transcription factor bHLH113 isoform X2 n=1 Tax=Capsella rubella TaxID=81985 RepID=UPI000CD53C42|nr:transcription factor bHLH113 isoform X2 [Capsella rubella]
MRGTTEEEDGVTNFSDVLLLSNDVLGSSNVGEDSFGVGFIGNDTTQMLCFGGRNQNNAGLIFSGPSSSNMTRTVNDKSSRSNRTGSSDEHDRVCDPKPGKRCKRDQKKSSVKVSEKITALQQLVSPYGKTDTASVLNETTGYIKFLQDQVQVLSSPYLKHHTLEDEDTKDVNPTMRELKNNGLCLVPLAWTVHVANTNGADLWSPAILSPTVNQYTVEAKSYQDNL